MAFGMPTKEKEMQKPKVNFDEIVTHTQADDCVACRAQELTVFALLPATAAWEVSSELPRFSIALHGAAGLIGTMLEEGVARESIEDVLSHLLDDIEAQIAEHSALGGPTQGNA